VTADARTITVHVPNPLFKDWLMKHYAAVITEAMGEIRKPNLAIDFVSEAQTDESPRPLAVADARPPLQEEVPPTAVGGSAGLNPRYTFDTFIVGSSNQFAHAACRAVAEAPSRSYNPLFIYGGVGLGKTHLMHAVGQYVLQHDRNLKLTYISSERFMNEMINAVRYDRVIDFRERYRTVDVLLVDDIQFLAGKEGTQTEFFHTFNALYDSQKQIVISSDCPPHEIPSLEERLRSRFEWGLIADIGSPDLETKIAILKKKAEAETIPLPDNVAIYIASKIKSNIRELEGSLIRLIAYASLTGQELSLPLAQEVLRNIIDHDEKAVTIEVIQKHVADYYNLKLGELKSRNNSKSVAKPRQIAMYLCKSLTHASLPEIGRSFGGKHHSTVIHSIRKVEEFRKKDGDFNTLISSFLEAFQ
jgi:chromosomal replication initiator protein